MTKTKLEHIVVSAKTKRSLNKLKKSWKVHNLNQVVIELLNHLKTANKGGL